MLTIADHDAIRAAAKELRVSVNTELSAKHSGKLMAAIKAEHPIRFVAGYLRYEALRKLNAAQYARLSALHLALGAEPRVTFDELVDLLVIGELTV